MKMNEKTKNELLIASTTWILNRCSKKTDVLTPAG